MTQEDKELLLKDLCGRLPYGVKCQWDHSYDGILIDVCKCKTKDGFVYWDCYFEECDDDVPIEIVKPYLRPMSNMTNEEVKDLLKVHIRTKYGENSDYYKNLIRIERISMYNNNSWNAWVVFKNDYDKLEFTTCFIIGRVTFETTVNEIDWLNANHFDYRGLIEKDLALKASKEMY